MITTAEFKKHIAKSFGQEMRQYGFKGTGFEYFQNTEDFLIAIYISPGTWGGNCTAGFAIHPKQIDKHYDGKRDLEKLKIYQYEFKMGLTDYERGERWDYADEETDNLATLTKIIKLIKEKVFPVIELFKKSPNILELFEVSEMDKFHYNWTKKTGVTISTTDLRFAWAMTLVFEQKNIVKANEFAKWGLSNLTDSDNNWFGKKDFDRVLT
ncbi:MAG: DUF4304 domain-containing protein [Pedobacter sp.]|nr:DUF4304 domain-containing protein [Chitinophagaceae bacterium]